LIYGSTQTPWFRKVNRADQVNFPENRGEVDDDNVELIMFLQTVYPSMEKALQSNETIDIFQDDFNVLPEEDLTLESSDMTNQIKEYKSFSNLQCEGKKITCIQFQPSVNNPRGKFIVAESFIENLSFDERAILAVKSYKSMIMFWDFEDIHSIEPILTLSSPLEILCFDFNPKDPNIVVAGAINGQVLMWNLGGATSSTSLTAKKVQKAKQERSKDFFSQ
jgi:WD40 repeat protein